LNLDDLAGFFTRLRAHPLGTSALAILLIALLCRAEPRRDRPAEMSYSPMESPRRPPH